MAINNTILYDRSLTLQGLRHSAFLFGPRSTGKTSLLKKLSATAIFDLLNSELELQMRAKPKRFWEEISILKPGELVIVDEVQRVPSLLDYVQLGIENLKLKFILSGSSARKLKRGEGNLWGGACSGFQDSPVDPRRNRSRFFH